MCGKGGEGGRGERGEEGKGELPENIVGDLKRRQKRR